MIALFGFRKLNYSVRHGFREGYFLLACGSSSEPEGKGVPVVFEICDGMEGCSDDDVLPLLFAFTECA